MKIAVASGKGGTGKTTVAVSLALAAAAKGLRAAYMDCDVEAPNGALFLKPETTEELVVTASVPELDPSKCVGCRKCAEICRFNAVALVGKKVLLFPELCHGCGGCRLVCPTGALRESGRAVGKITRGRAGEIGFVQGRLRVGEAKSPPVIREVRKNAPECDILIIDSPPGTSCPVVASVTGADFVLLVTEPTPFGLNDLTLAAEMTRALGLPFAVVVNRARPEDTLSLQYCRAEGIDILAEIPDDRRMAEAYSRGETAFASLPERRGVFVRLLEKTMKKAGRTK